MTDEAHDTNVKRVEVFHSKGEGWYWRAIAGNNEIVANSEGYTTKWSAARAANDTWPYILVEIVEDF